MSESARKSAPIYLQGSQSYRSNRNPRWEQHSRILRSTRKIQHPRSDISDQEVGGEKSYYSRSWGIRKEPVTNSVSIEYRTCEFLIPYHRDMRQSVKKNERYAVVEHCRQSTHQPRRKCHSMFQVVLPIIWPKTPQSP